MNVVIMCAGCGHRWDDPTPKELALIKGIPNLQRTIQMLEDKPIVITSPAKKQFFEQYDPIIGSDLREIDRFRNLFNWIDNQTVILYGDCLYDPFDLETIMITEPRNNTFFGRKASNPLTGKKWGEILAIRIVHPNKFIESVNKVARLFDEGKIKREIGWEVYRVDNDMNPATEHNHFWFNFVELSHYTDDFDTIEEYNSVVKNCL